METQNKAGVIAGTIVTFIFLFLIGLLINLPGTIWIAVGAGAATFWVFQLRPTPSGPRPTDQTWQHHR